MATIRATGMPWYRPEDYDAIRRVMSDGHRLPVAFDVWRAKAESEEEKLRGQGQIVVRAYIDPETFPDWCRARGLDVDAHARIRFAIGVARELHGASQ